MADNFSSLAGFLFHVKFVDLVDDDIIFQEVSGLSTELEIENIKEGGANEFVHRLPKDIKYNNLLLKRGVGTGAPLMNWITQAVETFKFVPKNVIVSLLDEEGVPLRQWTFQNAYPVAVKVAYSNVSDGKVLIETLELSYSYFTKTSS